MTDFDAIFKAYDVRGTVPDQFDADGARAIGGAFARFVAGEGATSVVVGRDMRPSGEEFTAAFADGVMDHGLDVVDVGLCATDMMFGVNWVFGRERVGDYQVGYFKQVPDWPVALAVAASSCFPPPFQPMHLKLSPADLTAGKATAKGRYADIVSRLKLTDGGVYDNMGLEPVWKSHADLLISDGGGTFKFEPDDHVLDRLNKYASIATNQVSALRRRWLFDRERNGDIRFARWHVGSAVANYDPDAPGYSRELAKEVIRHIRTDMDCFSHAEIAVLENQGYLVADASLRKHAGHLLDPARQAPLAPPHPEWMDEAKAAKALARSHKRFPITGRYRWFH